MGKKQKRLCNLSLIYEFVAVNAGNLAEIHV